jgi:threonine/homoserine/homoserine lactone efflux protein
MSLQLYLAFMAATTVLMLIPGPNVAVISAASVAHGPRAGLITVAGTCAALVLQLGLVGLGMHEAMGLAAHWFAGLRWAGVAYLLWLGVRAWRARPEPLAATPAPSARAGALRGFVVSAANPKTLFFLAAFFPQFVVPGGGAAQIWILAATFLAMEIMIDSGWALLAGRLRGLLTRHARARNRITGAALIVAGAGLAAARSGG